MANAQAQAQSFTTYRFRDLVACLVVMAIGAAVLYTVKTSGTDESIRLAGQAFLIGGLLLGIAYGGGAAADRLTRRATFLTRPRSSWIFLALVGVIGVAGLVFGFMESPQWYRQVSSQLLPY